MPIYEYACPKCKAQYELRQGFDAETTHTCEECGKGVAKRVLHAPPVVFKGSGWYVTDSKKAASAMSDSPSGDSDSKSETKGESKGDKKASSSGAKDSGASPEAAAAG